MGHVFGGDRDVIVAVGGAIDGDDMIGGVRYVIREIGDVFGGVGYEIGRIVDVMGRVGDVICRVIGELDK